MTLETLIGIGIAASAIVCVGVLIGVTIWWLKPGQGP